MSIVQSRMIDLISAAMDYQHAYQTLLKLIHTNNRDIEEGRQDAEEAYQRLALEANDYNLLQAPSESPATISKEHYHFVKNKKRNEWNREYREKHRTQPRQRNIYEPKQSDFIPLAQQTTSFRVAGQNKRGDMPKHTVRDLSPESKWEIDNRPIPDMTQEQEDEYKAFLRRRDEEAANRTKDPFQSTGEIDEIEL